LDYLHVTEDRKESSVASEFLEKDAACQAMLFCVEYQLDDSNAGDHDNFLILRIHAGGANFFSSQ
jgi:hypothetical protein